MTTKNSIQPDTLNLDPEDVRNIVSHPDRDVRSVLTQKICRHIKNVKLSDQEQAVVTELLRLIAKDAAAMVRRALAITLKNSPNLPHDIAQKLIQDVDSIAVPILSHSPVLTDEDLLEILKSKAAAKMMAITKRPYITGNLVKALVRFGDSHIVASVAANDGAEIDADMGAHMLDLYYNNDLIKESFIARRELPPTVVEKLISLISAEAALRLNAKHEIPLDIAIELAGQTRERAQIDFISQSWVSRDLKSLIQRLYRENRLTTTLIVRAACCGQMQFVEQALAIRAEINLRKSSLMLHDGGPFGLKALCERSGLGAADFTLLRASLVIYRDLEIKGGNYSKEKFQTLMLERVLTLPLCFTDADMDYLFDKLDAVQGDDMLTPVSISRIN